MERDQIVKHLKEERDHLHRAIAALDGGSTSTRGRAPGRRGGGITAAGRKRLSEMMKRRWAARKAAAAGKKK